MIILHYKLIIRRGNVLLLALLMLAGGMVGTLALTSIVTSQLRQSRVIDAGMIAHYEAESALEEGLYSARKLNDTIPIPSAPVCSNNVSTGDLGCTTVDFEQSFTGSNEVLVPSLKTDETFELDISGPATITELTLEWYPANDYTDGPQLAITYIGEQNGVPMIKRPAGNGITDGVPFNCVSSDPNTACSQLTLEELDNIQKVRFRALAPQGVPQPDSGDIKNLKIRPNNCGTPPCSFSKYVDLRTKGKKGDVGYTVQVSIPTSVPAYGIADYVLFSEQEVKK